MSEDLPQTPKGKIGRLPARIREAVNRRLHDGESAAQILPWLNGLTEVKDILARQFAGEEISAQNLSAWRNGGFKVWEKEQRQIARTRERALVSIELAKASGGNLSEGALAMLTGEVMDMVDEIAQLREAGQEINPKALTAINKSLVAARAKELETQALALKQRQTEQRQEQIDLANKVFELRYVEKFIEHAANEEAHRIATSTASKEVKMEQLRLLLFGAPPDVEGEAAP